MKHKRIFRVLTALGFALASATPGISQSWSKRAVTTRPGVRADHATASDPSTGNVLLFGGYSATNFGDTWTFDGTRWTNQSPATAPSARGASAMATDLARGVTVLFGGFGGSPLGDTWEWDGSTWSLITPPVSPPARHKHAMAYDPNSGGVVLFGGEGAFSLELGDAWVFDGVTWAPIVGGPGPRVNHALEFDAGLGVLVLFGGFSLASSPPWLSDTWTYDGAAGAWSLLSPVTVPPGREEHALAYDPIQGRMILFGGFTLAGLVADQWAYSGGNWVNLAPSGAPTARDRHSMDYGPRGELIVFGGGPAFSDDTWTQPMITPVLEGSKPAVEDLATPRCTAFVPGLDPRATSDDLPQLGSVIQIDLTGFHPNRPSSALSIGFQWSSGSCPYLGHVYTGLVWIVPMASGSGSLQLPLPTDPVFAGTLFYAQGFAQEPVSNQYYTSTQMAAVIGY